MRIYEIKKLNERQIEPTVWGAKVAILEQVFIELLWRFDEVTHEQEMALQDHDAVLLLEAHLDARGFPRREKFSSSS